jgi:hypothetical protein
MEWISERAIHFWQIVLKHVFALCFVLLFSAGSAALTWRDELLPPNLAHKWRVPTMMPHWDWGWWVLISAAIILVILIDGSYRVHADLKEKIGKNENTSHAAATLVATSGAQIIGHNTQMTGYMGNFALAQSGAKIDMSGANIIGLRAPPKPPMPFPHPTGEFSSFSKQALRDRTAFIVAELIIVDGNLQAEIKALSHPDTASINAVYGKYNRDFHYKLAFEARSLAAEMLFRLKTVSNSTDEAVQKGASVVLFQLLSGPAPASAAASFLEFLSTRLKDS